MKKNKLLAVFLALAMTLSLLPTAALAAEGVNCSDGCQAPEAHVAAIDTTHYTKLSDAVAEAQTGDTIKLLSDVALDEQLEIKDKEITLDLSGKKITYSGDTVIPSGLILVHNGAGLTIVSQNAAGTSSVSGGMVDAGSNGKVYAAVALTKKDDDSSKPAKLTLDYGTLKGYYYGIVGNGSRPNTEIVVDGGKVECYDTEEGAGIYHPQKGSLTINNGTITGATGVYFKSGTLSVTGGKINGIGEKKDFVHEINGFQSTGDALVIEACDYPGGVPTVVNMSGGSFKSTNNQAVAYYEVDDYHMENSKFITGGSYSSNPSAFVAEGYLCYGPDTSKTFTVSQASDFVAKIGEKKYSSLSSAVGAAQPSDTIVLVNNITTSSAVTLKSGNVVTIDMNDSNITFTGSYGFKLQSDGTNKGGSLTLIGKGTLNSATNGAFYIMGNNTADGTAKCAVTIGKDVTVTGGRYNIWITEKKIPILPEMSPWISTVPYPVRSPSM